MNHQLGDVIVFHMHNNHEGLYGEIIELHRRDHYILVRHDYADICVESYEISCNVTQVIEQLITL